MLLRRRLNPWLSEHLSSLRASVSHLLHWALLLHELCRCLSGAHLGRGLPHCRPSRPPGRSERKRELATSRLTLEAVVDHHREEQSQEHPLLHLAGHYPPAQAHVAHLDCATSWRLRDLGPSNLATAIDTLGYAHDVEDEG